MTTNSPKGMRADIQATIETCIDLTLMGHGRNACLEMIAERHPDVKPRRHAGIYEQAMQLMKETAREKREHAIEISISRLDDLFRRCIEIQDYKTALSVQKEMNTLLGLHAPRARNIQLTISKDIERAIVEASEELNISPTELIIAMSKED